MAGAAIALAAYAALGFWVVPAVIAHQLPAVVRSNLERQAKVGKIEFNPFTLRLAVVDLRLAEADGAPLFSIGSLVTQLQWRSIVRRAWSFAEIRITAPQAHLLIVPDGRFNLAELLATIERRPHEPSTDNTLPRLIVEHFVLEQGQVDMRDLRAGYANLLAPIDFELSHFSTLPDQDDTHIFSAESSRGGKLRWKGTASVNPIRASGQVTLENVSLPELSVYLKSYSHATISAGKLSAALPYSFAYADGKVEAKLSGATASLQDFALSTAGASDSFAALNLLEVSNVDADLSGQELRVGAVRGVGGKLKVRRNAKGEVDLASLMVVAGSAAPAPTPAVSQGRWKMGVEQFVLDKVAVSAIDETVSPSLKVLADQARLKLKLSVAQAPELQVKISDAEFSVADLEVGSGSQSPFRLARLGFTDGAFDLAGRRAGLGRVYAEGGQVQFKRDAKGEVNLLAMLPKPGPSAKRATEPATEKPWVASVKSLELTQFRADVEDQGSGVMVHVSDLAARLEGVGSELKTPIKFSAGLNLREGGQFSAQGSVVPETAALQAEVAVKQLALAPLQPLLARHLKLKIANGNVSARGSLTAATGATGTTLRYVGGFNVADLRLNEDDGELFASWKNVSAERLAASFGPNRLDIPQLRVVDANAKLIIEDDRSLNAARLLVQPSAMASAARQSPSPTTAQPAADPFPIRVGSVRLQNARLDFADLSLRPQFAARMYEMNGVINDLSTNRDSQSQIELDSRVDEFGSARIRGKLNPFAPADNTDVNVVFKNVDMVSASPYTMKFAGYKIAEGRISLDLQYKVRANRLEGANQIVIDKLTLGERVDSPDALKLPLELAIAILKDSDGRIDLGLPVSGDMSDPQFSYGAIVWKAIGNLLTRIVTAPFRALGSLLGIGGEKLESIDFDPGSDKLLPPEREKLKQVAQLLGKRTQLKLSVPGPYNETADAAALKAHAVRIEIARRAGVKLEAGDEPGPVNLGDRATRVAIRDLYAARFGDAELDKARKAAETAPPAVAAASAAGTKAEASQPKLGILQRVGKFVQGEPQVGDASSFYNQLLDRLNQDQPLVSDALTKLGAQRSDAIVAALKEAGVEQGRVAAVTPEKVAPGPGRTVPLKLGLAAR